MADKKQRRQQKAAEKARAKAKVRAETARRRRQHQGRVGSAGLEEIATWPIRDCFVSEGWHERGARVQVIVTRFHEAGRLAGAFFDIDLAEQGVVSAELKTSWQAGEYERRIATISEETALEMCAPGLAVKIIEAGAELNGEDLPESYPTARALCWSIEPSGPEILVGSEEAESAPAPSSEGAGWFSALKRRLGGS